MYISRSIPFLLLSLAGMVILCSSCELINPSETIPSFVRIDSIGLNTSGSQGSGTQDFTDAWVYADENLVGVYELPATVPIMASGPTSLRIRAGIKLNGQVATRVAYFFAQDHLTELELFEDSVIPINPTLTYHDWAEFKWLEGFDGDLGLSLVNTQASEGEIDRTLENEGFEGRSGVLRLPAGENLLEFQASDAFDLPGGGTPVLLEFWYRSNHPFTVGLFSRDANGTLQIPIIVVNSSDEWKRMYLNLTNVVSGNPNYIDHRPFFGLVRSEEGTGDIEILLDNIKLITDES